jgi:hypothetical protein
MIALICFVLAVLGSPFKSKSRLEAENAALRHQLIVLRRKMPGRPWLTNNDRWFFLQMYRWGLEGTAPKIYRRVKRDNDLLIYQQEYLAEFVDWAGVAFFYPRKVTRTRSTGPLPQSRDAVFAVIDTASKTGTENDATAVTFFAKNNFGSFPLLILDWDITQIEGAMLETWLPSAFQQLEELAAAVRSPLWSARCIYRRQKLRNNFIAAGRSQELEDPPHRIKTHRDGQG